MFLKPDVHDLVGVKALSKETRLPFVSMEAMVLKTTMALARAVETENLVAWVKRGFPNTDKRSGAERSRRERESGRVWSCRIVPAGFVGTDSRDGVNQTCKKANQCKT